MKSSLFSPKPFLLAALLPMLVPLPGRSQQAALPSEAPPSVEAKPDDYVRYVEGADSDRLETAMVRFVKGEQVVDLVAVVHVADAEYFDRLNEHLKEYDVVLYELMGGESETRDERFGPEAMKQAELAHSLVRTLFGMEYQTEGIDYQAGNFVHADVDWKEFRDLMATHNESVLTLFQRAFFLSQNGSLPGIPNDEEAAGEMLNTLVNALARGDAAGLKRTVAPMLGDAEDFIVRLEGDRGTVLVSERNKVVMKVLEEELGRGRDKVAILYGAGHMPGLGAHLAEAGFRRQSDTWLTAWDIREPPPSAQPSNFWQQLFSNPELGSAIMGTVQEIMSQFGNDAATSGTPPDVR